MPAGVRPTARASGSCDNNPPRPLRLRRGFSRSGLRPIITFRACAMLGPCSEHAPLFLSPPPTDPVRETAVRVKRIHVTTGNSVRGEEGERKEEGALWAVKWRLSEWEIQLQRLQPRSRAAEALPRLRGGGGRSGPAIHALRLPLPSFPALSFSRPVHRHRGPSRAAAPARPFPAGSPLARLRSGPPSASPFPSPFLLPPSLLPSPLPHSPPPPILHPLLSWSRRTPP